VHRMFALPNVCHVIRDHEENKKNYAGPRFLTRYTELEMHPWTRGTGSRCCARDGPRVLQQSFRSLRRCRPPPPGPGT